MTSVGGEATDLLQVLLVSKHPVVGLRPRRGLDALRKALLLAPELEQMGQPLGIFGQLTARRSRQSADGAVDESLTDIGRGGALLGEPSSALIAASHIVSHTVPSIALLLQGGG
jgi:hypothetical protein